MVSLATYTCGLLELEIMFATWNHRPLKSSIIREEDYLAVTSQVEASSRLTKLFRRRFFFLVENKCCDVTLK